MLSLISKIWKPIPKGEVAALYEEKLRMNRVFSVMVMWLGAFLSVALWAWDFAIDPVGAPNALIYRFYVAAILAAFGLCLHFQILPRFRTIAFVLTMVASQAFLYPILDVLKNGHMIGMGAFLFWYIFAPLVGVGLTLKDTLYGMVALALAPLLWYALGWTPELLVDVFIMYMWPAGSVVVIILVINNQTTLHMIRNQKRLEVQKKKAEELARTDTLTGMNNRRAFFDLGGVALQNAARYKHALSVVLLDLDHFKRVNDTYGHAVGDAVIKAMAKAIEDTARESDVTGRLGGEEFAVILTQTDMVEAKLVAERLRRTTCSLRVETGDGDVSFSASFGVATLGESEEDLDVLVAKADAALYVAKDGGRNRVASRET